VEVYTCGKARAITEVTAPFEGETGAIGEGKLAVDFYVMKAIVISRLGGPEVLEVRDVPEPVPSGGHELVRVEAAGLNFADVMTAQGGYPGAPKPPLVAGREFCGVIIFIGKRHRIVSLWRPHSPATSARWIKRHLKAR